MAPFKKPRVSKNKKKNWNKVCDIRDVEDFLEEKRFEERIGGAVSEKTDEELFFVGKEAGVKASSKTDKKTLKCFQNIGSYSKVPPPVKPCAVRYSKKIKNHLTKIEKKRIKRILKKTPQATKKASLELFQPSLLFSGEIKDLWADDKKTVDPEIEDLINYRDVYTGKKAPKVPDHRYQKPSLLPAVEVPHPGASYNPDFFEHQELLCKAVLIEKAKEKEELHLERVLTSMFPTKEEAPTEQSILQEMSQGLFEEDDDDDEEDNEADSTLISYNPPVSFENRVTKAKKRKRKELKEKERLRLQAKLQKQRMNQFNQIRRFKREIKEKDAVTEKKVERNKQRKIEEMYKPKVLSSYKYKAPDLEVKLTEELCGSFRTLKPEGNLLEDRYKSLQRRNMLESRIKQKIKRKYKRKIQVKRSHRDVE